MNYSKYYKLLDFYFSSDSEFGLKSNYKEPGEIIQISEFYQEPQADIIHKISRNRKVHNVFKNLSSRNKNILERFFNCDLRLAAEIKSLNSYLRTNQKGINRYRAQIVDSYGIYTGLINMAKCLSNEKNPSDKKLLNDSKRLLSDALNEFKIKYQEMENK